MGKTDGLGFDTRATPIDELGSVDGKQLDAIIGAETMEAWEIKLDPKKDTRSGYQGLYSNPYTTYCRYRIII